MIRPWHSLGMLLAVFFMVAAGMWCHAGRRVKERQTAIAQSQRVAGMLGLGAPVLSTEAPHLRHLILSPPLAAFHDIPGGLDCFSTSTFISPPASGGRSVAETGRGGA